MYKGIEFNQKEFFEKLFPIRRDIISDGYDIALEIIHQNFPLIIHEYPTNKQCWTWKIPYKWECKEAYISTLDGMKILDINLQPLCIASYSRSMNEIISRDELIEHLYTHQQIAEAVPFIFFYYLNNWGFCCSHQFKEKLTEPSYRIIIKSKHEKGNLKVGELFLQGETEQCIHIGAHLDHAFQANDGLSGVITGLAVMNELAKIPNLRYSYRMLITPETIGSIAWLSDNEDKFKKIVGGIFLDMTATDLPPALQLSYSGNSEIDKCFSYVHSKSETGAWIGKYREVVGNDERQYNAPGVRIPMLSYARANPWGHLERPYKEYHSNHDNLSNISYDKLYKSKEDILKMIICFEKNFFPVNNFKGEVFLSGYNISVDRHKHLSLHRNMLKIMDMIDGTNSIIDIAVKLDLNFEDVVEFINKLKINSLIL